MCARGNQGYTCVPGCEKDADCGMLGAGFLCCEDAVVMRKVCIDTRSDNNNCGMCGTACMVQPNSTPMCMNSVCRLVCNMGFGDCNMMAGDGCETNLNTSDQHCGKCGTVCNAAKFERCKLGRCEKDKVLVVGAAQKPHLDDVKKVLDGTMAFEKADLFEADKGTPTLMKLQEYDAVLVFSEGPFRDSALLGNNLAAYFEGGGRVVVAVAANTTAAPLGGRFAQSYLLIGQGNLLTNSDALGMIPQHSLTANVMGFSATQARRSNGVVINGGSIVARWGISMNPLIVTGTFMVGMAPRSRVDLNFYPPSNAVPGMNGFWTGDGDKLLRNALLYGR